MNLISKNSTDVQILATKDFTRTHVSLYKLGGNRRNIFKKLNDLLAIIKIDGAKAFQTFKNTKHGESRIKGCIKYELGNGFRLITIQSDRIIWLLFCGSHDECDKWLNKNSGLTATLLDGDVIFTRQNPAGSIPELRNDPVPSGMLLIDRLGDTHVDIFLDCLAGSVARNISDIKGNVNQGEIYKLTEGINDTEQASLVQDVLLALLEDDREGAIVRIDMYNGLARTEENWSDEEIISIKIGSNVYDVFFGSDDYLKKINEFARNGTSLEWLMFMHPEQKMIVDNDYSGVAQLSGVSGSGKTCIALRRAIRLAESSSEAKVLIVTLNQSLAGLIRQLADLSCDREEVLDRVRVLSMFELCQILLAEFEPDRVRYYGEAADKLGDNIDEVFREYYRLWHHSDEALVLSRIHRNLTALGIDCESYTKEEFDWIRSALPTSDRQKYLEIERTGRRHPLGADARQAMLKGIKGWESKMEAVGIIDYLGLTTALSKHFNQISPKFEHILIDEAQDFGTTELSILRRLVPKGPNDMFLCGDIAQHVLPKHRVLKNADIVVGGRTEKIIRNYRNTRQILEVAYAVLLNNLSEELLDTEQDDLQILDPKYANRSLNDPVLLKANSLEEEITYAIAHLSDFQETNPGSNACIVLAGYKHTEVKAYAKDLGFPALDGTLDHFSEPLVISDLEQTKGYEFDTVFIINCEEGILPPDGVPEEELYRFSCQLYVAMTRAKNDLYLSYHNICSRWLTEVGDRLTEFHWSDFEVLPDAPLKQAPKTLPETEWTQSREQTVYALAGRQFCFTKAAMSLSVEAQDKLIKLVDGRGARTAGGKGQTKWRSVGEAVESIKREANTRRLFGPQVSKELLKRIGRE